MKQIKKVLALVLIIIFTVSCEEIYEDVFEQDCACGTISNDGIDNGCYWLEIRNDCTSNKEQFCVDQDTWMVSYVGERFCMSNIQSW